jgi:outer membrane protein assembly factor BamD (BamD/ComL family)
MDRTREALAGGNGARALSLVDEYERRYPHGTFLEEAEVHRVEALVRNGDRAGARRAAARFVVAHPASPHAAHVRSLVGDTTP